MSPRRAALVALRVLAVYFVVQGIRPLADAIDAARSAHGVDQWIRVGTSAVPFFAGIGLWLLSETLAAWTGRALPMTSREIAQVLALEEGTGALEDEEEAETEPEAEPERERSHPVGLIVPALVVLGAFSVVRGLTNVASAATLFGLSARASFACSGLFIGGVSRTCPFWSPDRVQSAIALGANLVMLALGLWLTARPAAFLRTMARLGEKLRWNP